ncbi:XRE family transcriptional regulator [Sunxiuqinia indica]|uniref:XRE family transcriptional regulator n=1 Tax=Sunxiuqinia indica TaxID=2692584 RepID=UPI00135812FE|nr:LexA family transcriptional regulator [Sunxiuqinia indica]
MNYLAQNIKYLRRAKKWTQQQLADKLLVKRALIGSYEEGRATPKIQVIQQLAALMELSVDDLLGIDLEKQKPVPKSSLQVLSVVVDQQNDELIPIVPVKASAGYLNGFADPQYIGSLPRFFMPVPELSRERTYRVFQLKGDSMLPVQPGSYVFCEFIADVDDLKEGQPYILVTKEEGLVYKRVYLKENGQLLLKSDNPEYEAYFIDSNSVLELWRAKGVLSFELPKPESYGTKHISAVLDEMKQEIRKLSKS